MRMKKILAIAITTSMMLSLAACGSSAGNTASGTDTTADISASETTETADEAATDNGAVVTSTYAEGTAAAELADLFNGGYTMGCTTGSADGQTVINFYNDDHTEFRQAICTMTDEQSDALFNIDWMAEDYFQQYFDIVAACDDLEIITPDLPDMTEYEAMVGKTIGDLEDAGLEYAMSYDGADGNLVADFYVYPDENTTYTLHVTPDIEEGDDTFYDDEAIKELTVKEIVFWEFD